MIIFKVDSLLQKKTINKECIDFLLFHMLKTIHNTCEDLNNFSKMN